MMRLFVSLLAIAAVLGLVVLLDYSADQRERARVAGQLPLILNELRGALQAGRNKLSTGEIHTAVELLFYARQNARPYERWSEDPDLEALATQLDHELARAIHIEDARKQVVEARALIDSAVNQIGSGDYLAAEKALGRALDVLQRIDPAYAEFTDAPVQREDARRKRTQIAKQVARQTAQVAKTENERAVIAALCGTTPPQRSQLSGGIFCIESYLKDTANNPSSIEVNDCTPPVLTKDRCWVTVCKVRGANLFGGKILRLMRFSVGQEAHFEELCRVLDAKYVE